MLHVSVDLAERSAGFLSNVLTPSLLHSAKLALLLGTVDKRSFFLVLKKY